MYVDTNRATRCKVPLRVPKYVAFESFLQKNKTCFVKSLNIGILKLMLSSEVLKITSVLFLVCSYSQVEKKKITKLCCGVFLMYANNY